MGGPMSETASFAGSRPPALATTTLAVANMHCGGCMRKVETTLAAIPGVVSARANLSAQARERQPFAGRPAGGRADRRARPRRLCCSRAGRHQRRRPRCGRSGLSSSHRRRRVRGGQHHAAIGVGVVKWRNRDVTCHPVLVPLALGPDRLAGHCLCRHPVLSLGRASAVEASRQHGRADLARRHAGNPDERLPKPARERTGLLRRGDDAAVLLVARAVPRSAHAGKSRRRRRQSHWLGGNECHRHQGGWVAGAHERQGACTGDADPHRRRRARCRRRSGVAGFRRGRPEPDYRREQAMPGCARRLCLCRDHQSVRPDGRGSHDRERQHTACRNRPA